MPDPITDKWILCVICVCIYKYVHSRGKKYQVPEDVTDLFLILQISNKF